MKQGRKWIRYIPHVEGNDLVTIQCANPLAQFLSSQQQIENAVLEVLKGTAGMFGENRPQNLSLNLQSIATLSPV